MAIDWRGASKQVMSGSIPVAPIIWAPTSADIKIGVGPRGRIGRIVFLHTNQERACNVELDIPEFKPLVAGECYESGKTESAFQWHFNI